jgi:23S rRNA pseudouridine2605 synthase
VHVISSLANQRTLVSITIYEGRKRQVRRMFKTLGYEIERLKRTGYSFLTLGDLQSGEYRFLTKREIERLKS